MLQAKHQEHDVMGEVLRFWETRPFEVDGIVYFPPQMETRYTMEFYRHRPMFELKADDMYLDNAMRVSYEQESVNV